jgi:AraC family transcriptional regulator
MNTVIQFIDETLDLEVSVSSLAKMAFYSEFHFHRIFSSYVGESVYAYRKRLLLERAVKFLQYTDKTMTEIAFDSGYDNHSSFNKAFKKFFKHSPTEVRQNKIKFEKYSFPQVEEGLNMKVEIVKIEDVKVIAARGVGLSDEVAADAWGRIMKFAYGNGHMKGEVRRFGITHDDPNVTDIDKIRYDACLDLDVDISGRPGLKNITIAGGKYAQFTHIGSYDKLGTTYNYAFNQWLPNSGYELRIVPCFDLYLNKDPRRTKPENLKTIIHIPLV